MVGGFRERAQAGQRAARRPSARRFWSSAAPQGEPIEEAIYFHRKLVEAELPFGGVIVNRVHAEPELEAGRRTTSSPRSAERSATRTWPGGSTENFADYRALVERDRAKHRAPARADRPGAVIWVPELDEDVHDLAGLLELDRYLFGSREREALAAGAARASRFLGCGCGG